MDGISTRTIDSKKIRSSHLSSNGTCFVPRLTLMADVHTDPIAAVITTELEDVIFLLFVLIPTNLNHWCKGAREGWRARLTPHREDFGVLRCSAAVHYYAMRCKSRCVQQRALSQKQSCNSRHASPNRHLLFFRSFTGGALFRPRVLGPQRQPVRSRGLHHGQSGWTLPLLEPLQRWHSSRSAADDCTVNLSTRIWVQMCTAWHGCQHGKLWQKRFLCMLWFSYSAKRAFGFGCSSTILMYCILFKNI